MTVEERPEGDVVVLDVKGEMMNYMESGSLKRRVGELLGRGHLSLLLNLSQVPYMNSRGVGELASAFVSVRNRHGKLKVAASQSRVMNILALSKLDTVIEMFDTEAEALHSFDSTQQA